MGYHSTQRAGSSLTNKEFSNEAEGGRKKKDRYPCPTRWEKRVRAGTLPSTNVALHLPRSVDR